MTLAYHTVGRFSTNPQTIGPFMNPQAAHAAIRRAEAQLQKSKTIEDARYIRYTSINRKNSAWWIMDGQIALPE